ncbi:Retron-type RNA-directed DNA polymerase, partial [hydrothermal vent metagenome]
RLECLYEPVFIYDVYSNRKGKGTHGAVKRLQHFMRATTNMAKNGQSHYLQLDIHNFFNSIDRAGLFEMLQHRLRKAINQQKITREEAVFLRYTLHMLLRQEVAKEAIIRPGKAAMNWVPAHKRLCNAPPDKGLPIGNLSSQFFANVYLNELDQFIKHRLKCRHYLRYVDDFILLHPQPSQLQNWLGQIEQFLARHLDLRLKPEVICRPVNQGADFLGYITRPHYCLVRKRVVGHLKDRLHRYAQQMLTRQPDGRWRLTLDVARREALRAVLSSYLGHFKHAASERLLQQLFDRFWWLHCLFIRRDTRLEPLWQPRQVTGYRSQYLFFQRYFPFAHLSVQRGYRRDRFAPTGKTDRHKPGLPERCCVEFVNVTEQGYLKGGLKRRVIEFMVFPCELDPRWPGAAGAPCILSKLTWEKTL